MYKPNRKTWRLYREHVASGDIADLQSLGVPGLKRRRGFAPTGDGESDVNELLEKLLYLWSEAQSSAEKVEGDMGGDKSDEEKVFELGMELLHVIRHGSFERFKELIDAGVPVNFQSPKTGETALHIVAEGTAWGYLDVLEETGKVDYLIRDFDGRLAWNNADFFCLDPRLSDHLLKMSKEQAERDGVDLLAEHKGWLVKWFNEPWFNQLSNYSDFTPD